MKSKFFWINIAIAVSLLIAVLVVLDLSLGRITQHGDMVEVPNLIGMNEEEARAILATKEIDGKVIDSIYVKGKKLGVIVEQNPVEKTKVKKGRHIYLTVNSKLPRMIPMPDLKDMSYRQAEATLKSIGFSVKDIQYIPSEFSGLVLEIKHEGEPVGAGTRLPDGANIVLVVGRVANEGDMARVPQLCMLTYERAVQTLSERGFVVGAVMNDETVGEEEDRNKCFVYRQSPAAEQWTMMGKRVDMWLTRNPNKIVVEESHEEEFF